MQKDLYISGLFFFNKKPHIKKTSFEKNRQKIKREFNFFDTLFHLNV